MKIMWDLRVLVQVWQESADINDSTKQIVFECILHTSIRVTFRNSNKHHLAMNSDIFCRTTSLSSTKHGSLDWTCGSGDRCVIRYR